MSFNIESIIEDFLSPNESLRKKADSLITSYFNSMNISDLSNFYSILKTSQSDIVKLYISIYIKNYIEQKITSENRDEFIQYLNTFKYDILNIILNTNLEKKTINLLIISLCKGLSFFQIDIKIYNKVIYELCSYIFQFYTEQKNNNGENNNNDISRTLFICYKFMKNIDKDMKNFQDENLFNLDNINDNELNNSNIKENDFETLNLNFYNVIVLKENNREKILETNYNLVISLFNKINKNNNKNCFSNYLINILSLSNKIIQNYLSTHIIKITLDTIKI